MPNSLPSIPVLQVSVVRNRDSNEMIFIRTNVAIYFISLLILNILQAIGGLLNIPWLVANRVYNSAACTAQGVIKEISNVRYSLILYREE